MNQDNNNSQAGTAEVERLSTGDLILQIGTVAIVCAAVYSLVTVSSGSECIAPEAQAKAEAPVQYAPSGVAIPSQREEDRVEHGFAGTQLDPSRGLVMPSQLGWKLKSPYVNNGN